MFIIFFTHVIEKSNGFAKNAINRKQTDIKHPGTGKDAGQR
jgi:hypothetical protein